MFRCVVRATNILRRSSVSSKKKPSLRFRQYTSISRNFRRTLSRSSSTARNVFSSTHIQIPATTPLLFHTRHFAYNPDSNNPHRGNDNSHSGSIGQYADALFESWQADPNSVDKSWREYFDKYYGYFTSGDFLEESGAPSAMTDEAAHKMITDAANLLKFVRAYQSNGHYIADLDPLGILKQGVDRKQFFPELLKKETWGFTDKDYDRQIYVGDHSQFLQLMGKGFSESKSVTLRAVEERLRDVYCGTIGYQYMHIANHEKNQFLRKSIEREIQDYKCSNVEKVRILDRLMWAEEFENFLDVKYPAQKRFGINGAESFVPLVKEVIDEGARLGIDDFIIGMPHRGRLLFLATCMRKPLWQIFYEFRGMAIPWEHLGDSGDVKYHLGHSLDRRTPDGLDVHLSLFPNPSHLEAVDPVIMGKTRAKQFWNGDKERNKTCAIIIHGDASFSGQGVVYESMALTDLPKYTTGGVVHIVVNNQIGFTTDAQMSRSSPYCTDVARSSASPIFHVNGDDPEAVCKSAKMAMRFRQQFASDTVLDMLCFRRYGHNEGDEPMFTQPEMYKVIAQKVKDQDVVVANYKKKLMAENVLTAEEIVAMEQRIRTMMADNYEQSANREDIEKELRAEWLGDNWTGIKGKDADDIGQTPTGISKDTALYIADATSPSRFPSDLVIHRKLKKILGDRASSVLHGEAGGGGIDWGTAEQLAYGSLLLEGVHVRISGQDVERGTFSHRHAVVHDQEADVGQRREHVPLSAMVDPVTGAAMGDLFQASNSNLSEFGVLGFEYGYSCESPRSLVIWEAQFGDFANGAMVVFDQFVSSGEIKWLRQSGLVVLLPHGYEGGGPEHSSGRMERYLQMCNDDEDKFDEDWLNQITDCNWQCVNITDPANFFHCLRRQIHRDFRKPLIVFTPKFGLRHPLATSSLDQFLDGTKFKPVLSGKAGSDANKVKKLMFCSGKVWLELEAHRKKEGITFDDVVITRLEEIAPFPYNLVKRELEKYPNAELCWVQEEPKNMGAYAYVSPRMRTAVRNCNDKVQGKEMRYIGRKPNASPATGYPQVHKAELAQIINEVFE